MGRTWSCMHVFSVRRDTFIRGQRFSVLPALSTDGIVALDIFEGLVNKGRFIDFVNNDLVGNLVMYQRLT